MDTELVKARKYIDLAQVNADLFSKDPHTKVGAIVLAPDFSRVYSIGTNGFPRKMNDNTPERWERPTKYSYICHAEANAIANAARTGTPTDGTVVAVTKFPCSTCAKLLIQAGISKVYTPAPDYRDTVWGADAKVAENMFDEVGVRVVKFS